MINMYYTIGDKYTDKNYTWHTGYPGGLKTKTVKEQMNTKPEEVFHIIYISLYLCYHLHNYF